MNASCTLYRSWVGFVSSAFRRKGARNLKRSISSWWKRGQPCKEETCSIHPATGVVLLAAHLLLWNLQQKFGDEDSVGDEFQPGVGKPRSPTWADDVIHMTAVRREDVF